MVEHPLTVDFERRKGNFRRVGEFMSVMGQEVRTEPSFPAQAVCELRVALIQEELQELQDAIDAGNIVEVADAIADLLYVVYGAGHAFGIDAQACFDEVHRSNLTKLGPDGTAKKNEAGKILKPETYSPPNLHKVLFGESHER